MAVMMTVMVTATEPTVVSARMPAIPAMSIMRSQVLAAMPIMMLAAQIILVMSGTPTMGSLVASLRTTGQVCHEQKRACSRD